jgi:Na+/H+ antiporter NhaD/arsenite permease-like protein
MVTIIILIFILGYAAIAFEHKLKIDKAAMALVMGVLTWGIYLVSSADKEHILFELLEKTGEISGILFFLLGAMTIVELIDAHKGFEIISKRIRIEKPGKLLWVIGFLTFFLSAILDNLTTTIVMVTIIRRLIVKQEERWLFAGIIVISANAGGAWSPMGDVTTTMLWIGQQITAGTIIIKLIIPSLVCMVIPVYISTLYLKNIQISRPAALKGSDDKISFESRFVFFAGILALLSVPVIKTITHLPPFMAMMFALGMMWILTEIIHRKKKEEVRGKFSVARALQRTDTATILFFLGILLAISVMELNGTLIGWADFLTENISSQSAIVFIIGIISSIIDNVPLVAALQGMYPLTLYPTDHFFWEFLAYAAGTGGSMLIIGSAAGIAAMGMENIPFSWYLRKMTLLAFIGYAAGAGVYLLQEYLF